jgi:TATA-binding protein-associated factor Taf7
MEASAPAGSSQPANGSAAPAPGASRSLRPQRATRTSTRQTTQGNNVVLPQRLKFKLGASTDGGPASAHYDRELDSDEDEPLSFEEHIILRLPKGEVAERVHELVSKKELGSDGKKEEVWFKFKDSRRAVFGLGDKMYGAKLVDLPCILESQKTLDSKHMYKVADICQVSSSFFFVFLFSRLAQCVSISDATRRRPDSKRVSRDRGRHFQHRRLHLSARYNPTSEARPKAPFP